MSYGGGQESLMCSINSGRATEEIVLTPEDLKPAEPQSGKKRRWSSGNLREAITTENSAAQVSVIYHFTTRKKIGRGVYYNPGA